VIERSILRSTTGSNVKATPKARIMTTEGAGFLKPSDSFILTVPIFSVRHAATKRHHATFLVTSTPRKVGLDMGLVEGGRGSAGVAGAQGGDRAGEWG
jgi:hypothetical protein